MEGIFGEAGRITFESEWEVLLGQGEVVNWLRTTPEKTVTMRYPGEWKLAGGNVDEGEDVAAAALRELTEEFLAPLQVTLPQSAVIWPFVTKQTRPIRSQSNLMHNYVAIWEENEWLRTLDVDALNRGLEDRRQRFAQLVANGDFWTLSMQEREAVAPEVFQLAWVPLHEAVKHALSSMIPGIYVNAFQETELRKLGRKNRDPMFITAATLMELEGFPNAASLIRHCKSVDLARITKEEQWLFNGMTQAQVDEAFATRLTSAGARVNPSFKPPHLLAAMRQARLAASGTAKL